MEQQTEELRRRLRNREERLLRRRMLPNHKTLEKLTRYDAHLSWQELQALRTSERRQVERAEDPVSLPAVLET